MLAIPVPDLASKLWKVCESVIFKNTLNVFPSYTITQETIQKETLKTNSLLTVGLPAGIGLSNALSTSSVPVAQSKSRDYKEGHV